MKKKVIVTIIIGILILSLVVSSLSYAFYKTNGIGKEEHLSVVAKKLAVIFTDNSELTGEIYPGYEETKTFSVENKSESLFKYDIIFEDLVNTFETEGFLQYKITSNDGGFNCDWTDIPKSNEPTDTILAYSVEIENGIKHNYKLEIRYQDSDSIDQSIDMGRVLSGNLAIREGTKNPKLKQVTLNVVNGTPETSSTEVLEGNDATFEVTPNEKYTTDGAKLTCDNGHNTTINEETSSIVISNITTDTTCTLTMKKEISFIAKLKKDNPNIMTREASSFSSAFTGTGGLYKEDNKQFLEEDGRTQDIVYYFAGDGLKINNWVVFGGFWWRIIRTNEDGSVRLLYAGKATKDSDGKYTGHNLANGIIDGGTSVQYNSTYNNTMYVGYMYGTIGDLTKNRTNATSSTIKGKVDDWYTTNMLKTDDQSHQYGTYLSKTAIYCNDRATSSYNASSTMYYAGYYRLRENKRPSFKCGVAQNGTLYSGTGAADNADKFTGSQESTHIGNEKLGDKPIALMTADEIAYAGGVYGSNNANAWYYQNSTGDSITGSTYWWTMSPSYFIGSFAYVFDVYGSGYPGRLSDGGVRNSNGVRPVVSLKSCVEVTGRGTTDDPYIPSIDNACALADN